MKPKITALPGLLILLLLAVCVFIIRSREEPSSASQNDERTKVASRAQAGGARPAESKVEYAQRVSPKSWKPAAVFAASGTPALPLAFPRGENGSRRYHATESRELPAAKADLPPLALAKSPADGRFHLNPDEVDVHTLHAARMVFDPSALDQVISGNATRILAPAFGDEVLTVEFRTLKTRDANSLTLQGYVVDEESSSSAQFVYHDGIVQGNIVRYTTGQETEYRILADGHMMVREIDQSSMNAPCGNGAETEMDALRENLSENGLEMIPHDDGVPAEDTVGWRTVDVVAGYDAGARLAQGGYSQIEALIIASVDRMTTAFANSQIPNTELILLGTIEDPLYVYPGSVTDSMSEELGNLNNFNDGKLDTVSNFATDLGADLISFVLKDADGSAGIAYRPGKASITARTYMTATRITFAHELGHNIGCNHSWGDSSQSYETHYGWRIAPPGLVKVRTIMAYDWNWGSGQRIPYFANPNVSYNGAATGTVNGYNVQGDTTADQRYYQNGLSYSNGTFGFDGTKTNLAANNANTINTGAGVSSYGATYAGNRAARSAFNVTAPAVDGQWARGSTRTISFRGGDMKDIASISLYKGGVMQSTLASNLNPATKRNFPWAIPAGTPLGNDYMVRVSMLRNGSTVTADSGTFAIIDLTPYVVSQSPVALTPVSGTVSQIALTFNNAMNPATFAVSDDVLSFSGPGGADLKPTISAALWSSGNTVLTFGFPALSMDGDYQLVLGSQITDTQGNMLNQDQDLTPGEALEDRYVANFRILNLSAALDNTELTWSTGGAAPWFPQFETTHDGIDAARSGAISDNGKSSVETTIPEEGTLTFWWKVSSEANYDELRFYIDDVEQAGSLAPISGDVDWVQKSVDIPAGGHSVKWVYEKDFSISRLSDAAWLDQVTFTPAVAPEIAVEQPIGTDLVDGSANIDCGVVEVGNPSTQLTFTVKNTGLADLSGLALSVSGDHAADFGLGSLGATTIAPGGSTTFTVDFSPGSPGAKTATLQIASNDTDENPFDIGLTGTGSGPGFLAVSPAEGLVSAGTYGGPFSPASVQYTLSNPGNTPIGWTATKSAGWAALGATSGTLAPGASTNVTVSINPSASSLDAGQYNDIAYFTNSTSDTGSTTRGVSLTVNPIAASVNLSGLLQTYDGSPKAVTVTTTPSGIPHSVTYDGSSTVPTNAGTYAVVATVTGPNYQGSASGNLVIAHTVSYQGNGNTSGTAPADQTKLQDVNLTLAANSGNLNKTGYTFVGWNTAANGSGSDYPAAGTYSGNASLALYAKWALGADGTWSQTPAGPFNWGDAANWSGGTVAAGADRTAFFTPNITANQVVNLESARTIGNITFTDSTTSSHNLTISGANSLTLSRSSAIPIIDVTQSIRTLTISSEIAGSNGLQKNGPGTLTLSGANTYSGGTTINDGSIGLSSDANLGATTGGLTFNYNGKGLTHGDGLALDANRTITINGGVVNTFTNAITVNGKVTGAGGIYVNTADDFIFSNAGSDFTGPITTATSGSSSYGLKIASISDVAGVGGIVLGSGSTTGTFMWTGGNKTFGNRQFSVATPGASILGNLTTNNLIINQNLAFVGTGARALSLSTILNGSINFNGNLTDNGGSPLSLTVSALGNGGSSNGGTVYLSGTNTYTGSTTLLTTSNGGFSKDTTTVIQGKQALSPFTNVVITKGNHGGSAIKLLDDGAGTISMPNNFTYTTVGNFNFFVGNNNSANGGNGSGTTTGSKVVLGNLTLTLTGNVISVTGANDYRLQLNDVNLANANGAMTSTFNPTTAPLTIAGTVRQLGSANTGAMSLVLDGTANGNLISGNILESADGTPRTLALTKTGTGTWTLTGANAYTGPTTISGGVLEIGGGGTLGSGSYVADISIASTNSGTFRYNSTASQILGGAITGAGALVKDGSGSLTFAGTGNTYSGATTANAGKLLVNGMLSNTAAALTVNPQATLGGTGTIGRNVTIAAGGKLEFSIGTPSASHDGLDISVGRSFAFSGASELTITSASGASPGSYTLITGGNNITGSAPATVNLPSGWAATVSISGNSLLLNVTSTGGPGPVDHFVISPIASPQTVGAAIGGITITAQDASNATATGFTGTVSFGGSGGFSGTSTAFVSGVLSGATITPTVSGNNLTFMVNDGAGHTGTAVIATIRSVYENWSGNLGFNADSNGDGIDNGMAWAFGAANPSAAATALLPTTDNSDPTYFTFTYRRSDAANAASTIAAQYGTTLGSDWTFAVHDGTDIIIAVSDNFYGTNPGVDKVQVKIRRTVAPGGKLFTRLRVVSP